MFAQNSHEVELVDFLDFLPKIFQTLHNKAGKFPKRIEMEIRARYIKKIQAQYVRVINQKKPDLIFIYNDQMLLSDTLKQIRIKPKIGIFLADSPLFLSKREHLLDLLRKADVVFAPDSYWISQCKMLGIKNIEFLIPGYNNKHHYSIQPSKSDYEKYSCDIFFMGAPYPDNWGYKRALFLSKFCEFDFNFAGSSEWNQWFSSFPELKKHFKVKAGYLSDEDLNTMMNCAKIIPIDANPGIINGIHIRVFDTIATGVFPLIEYRKDMESIFSEVDIRYIKNYDEIPELVTYYLKNEKERKQVLSELQKVVFSKYSIKEALNTIENALSV